MIRVKVDIRGMEQQIKKLRKDVIPKVMARALNRAADGMRAEAVRTIAKLTGIKQKEVRSRMFVKGATPHQLWAEVGALPYAPNLSKFRATRNKHGVAASAWGQRKTYRGAFKAKNTVLTRQTPERKPLKPLYGPSVPKTFMWKVVQNRLEAVTRQKWRSEFEREMARRLARGL